MTEPDKMEQDKVEEDERLVAVGRFRDPMEMQLAKGMLEAAGIPCVLQGENANALYSGALRGRLQVKHVDEAAARALLAEAELEVPDGD